MRRPFVRLGKVLLAVVAVVLLILAVFWVVAMVWLFSLGAPPGMFRGDWVMEINNQSDEPVIVRVLANPEIPNSAYFITQVAPGSDGPAVAWRGSKDTPITVMDTTCTVLATFASSADDTITAPGVPGVSARVKPWYAFGANYTPGIDGTDDCQPER